MPDFHDYCEIIFWNFSRKNNTVYNFDIMNNLIETSKKSSNSSHFYKPILILMMSIIECALYDLLCRIQEHSFEGINLNAQEVKIIKTKDLPKQLKNYIDICNKHKLLGYKKPDVYKGLYKYLEIRNRVHIQNIKQTAPIKEWGLWDKKKVKSCGRLLHDIFLYICKTYPRPEGFHKNPDLNNFPTPWDKLE